MIPGALGASGAAERMQEIQDRMRSMFGDPDRSEFKNMMTGDSTSGMMGNMPGGPIDPSKMGITPDGDSPYKSMAVSAAGKYGIDPDLFVALVNQESGFNPLARSGKGALGLTQLMPGTAADMGVKDRSNPAQNLDGGAKYLRSLLDQFGTPELALAAYNAGPNAVTRAGGIPDIAETRNYVNAIMGKISSRISP